MTTLDFEKFEDGCDLIGPIRLIRHFGWFKGNYFLNLMESYIEKKTRDGQKPGNGRATFRDLVEKYGDRHFKRLYVFGTNLTQQWNRELGSAALPPSVRKGSAFPIAVSLFEAAPLMSRGGIASNMNRGAGEAEPHRTEGGKAAEPG